MNARARVGLLKKVRGAQKSWVSEILRNETLGGALLLLAAVSALVIANSPLRGWFFELKDFQLGYDAIDLRLSVGAWTADGLLALFFLAAGIELKHELVHGSLKEKSRAMVPIAAALGGMIVPATIYFLFNRGSETVVGWGIPMATDIAFALAILAVVGRRLPIELRAFLLTLAVVDDLGAIIVIALFYSAKFALVPLLVAIALLGVFALMQRKNVTGWYFYVPLALLIWYFVHESGIHATVAGVAMGLLVNMKKSNASDSSAGDKLLHLIHPYSAVIAVPIFAFFASGISLADFNFGKLTSSTVASGIFFGLVLGKPTGVFLGAFLVSKLSRAELSSEISWWDVAAIGSLAGVGFTVSLLISELAFKASHATAELSVLSVLLGSLTSALIATVLLAIRRRSYGRKDFAR